MGNLQRQSPIQFTSRPVKTEVRDHWVVVRAYESEGSGPWLVDLGHKTRWDFQNGRLEDRAPGGVLVPTAAGQCRLENRILVNRLNRTQAAIWHLGNDRPPELPAEPGTTDVSEATALVALLGPNVFAIAEKLTALDFLDPERSPPFLFQGPFSHVACQIVTLAREKDGSGALLLTCARGYARDMVRAVLTAGEPDGLCPAGEDRFTSWLDSIQT